ncbi:MAG: hypothetical protein ACLTE2_01415 [Eubacteriales bacterium]
MQHTSPGIPDVYYGDEAGDEGHRRIRLTEAVVSCMTKMQSW